MHWAIYLLPLAALGAFLLYKRAALMPTRDAVELLKRGALLIDVRSHAEYSEEHLPRALNMPVDRIESLLPERVTDKRVPLLLHCQSGMRSGLAVKKLHRLGYSRAFNLGSYARAEELVKAAL
jgi:phage shock protein E